jgi:hypothetical protein
MELKTVVHAEREWKVCPLHSTATKEDPVKKARELHGEA